MARPRVGATFSRRGGEAYVGNLRHTGLEQVRTQRDRIVDLVGLDGANPDGSVPSVLASQVHAVNRLVDHGSMVGRALAGVLRNVREQSGGNGQTEACGQETMLFLAGGTGSGVDQPRNLAKSVTVE